MSKKGGRLAQFKKKVEDLTIGMQKFCLNPSRKLFDDICACESVRRNEVDAFETWRLAVIYRFGDEWDLSIDPDTGKDVGYTHLKFLAVDTKLCEYGLTQPSRTKALQVLYIFFATGQLKYIDLFYQYMGHEAVALSTRRELATIYTNIKELYTTNVQELLQKDPEHFIKINVDKSHVDFSHFDQYKSDLEKHKENRSEDKKLHASFVPNSRAAPSFPTAIYGITQNK